MPSCLVLERPGRWRLAGLVCVALVLVGPAVPLLVGATGAVGRADLVLSGYLGHLGTSITVGLVAAVLGFAVGWPSGVVAGLYRFPGRVLLMAILALPLLLPSFLLGLGWSILGSHVGGPFDFFFDGAAGVILVFFAPACGLSALAALAATSGLGSSRLDAARLAGGERAVVRASLAHAAPISILAATLTLVLSLGDPGPGQIFGVRTAASDLLMSFSATYDFELAGLQSALLAIVVLVAAVPLATRLAPLLARPTQARSKGRPTRFPGGTVRWVLPFWIVAVGAVLLPTISLIVPMVNGGYMVRGAREFSMTILDTVVFGGGAALVAVGVAVVVAGFTGREERLRQAVVAIAVALFCLPPVVPALGAVRIATAAPHWLDPILRGSAGVCLAQGLRLAPVAVVLLLRAWGATAPSWTLSAAVSGVPLQTFLRRVMAPILAPAIAISGLLVALLALADVTSVLLLAPPGRSTFALRIFTVMANAPQALVATLCFLYVVVAVLGVAGLLRWGVKGEE